MEIQGKGTIYKNQYGYSISDNQKQPDGTVNKFYIPIKFKKGLQEPNDRDYVSIQGFTKPYKTKEDKTGISYFIMDWALINSTNALSTNQTGEEITQSEEKDAFAQFKEENQIQLDDLELDDDSLPF